MIEKTIKCKLITKKSGLYIVYVFQDLVNNEYLMCTKLPNWDSPEFHIGDVGYLTFEDAKAGEKYFDPKSQTFRVYNYTNMYFKNFIKEVEKIDLTI